jgi:hypothetical protein
MRKRNTSEGRERLWEAKVGGVIGGVDEEHSDPGKEGVYSEKKRIAQISDDE